MGPERFAFAWDRAYELAALPFGITRRHAYAEVGPSELFVRFGPWSLRTALGNITGSALTGGYAFLKTAGPPHLSFGDRGITFATNSRAGVCLELREPVKGIDPSGTIRHPGATLTLTEPDAFAKAIGHPLAPT